MKGPISLDDLDVRREEILAGIAERDEVWEIRLPGDGGSFALGPPDPLEKIAGLHDEQYGWPTRVDADAAVDELVPGRRRHPFLYAGDELVAVAVWPEEYADILRSLS